MGQIIPTTNLGPTFKTLQTGAKGGIDVGKSGLKALAIKPLINSLPLPQEQKDVLQWLASNATDYIAFCAVTPNMIPYTKTSMIAFVTKNAPKILASGAKGIGQMGGHQTVECISQIALTILQFNSRLGLAKGGPIGITAGIGLLLLDALEIGNSCEFVQEGYYNLFLKTADIKLKPVQRQSRQIQNVYTILEPTLPTAHNTLMSAIPR
jgi:hypothetical protein